MARARGALWGVALGLMLAAQPLLLASALVGAAPPAAPLSDAALFREWRHESERPISAEFLGELELADPAALVEAIVQFRDKAPTPADMGRMTALGLEVVRAYTVIPGYAIRGPAGALLELAAYPRLFFLEPNRPLLLDQEISTSVINASLVWESQVRGAQNFPGGVDGTGVTVVVVDTGIDAGHPDLDYGAKTLMNLQETVPGVWSSFENTDTAVGHGTHVAGTVAGNGEASAGARRGVAPGANLIGLTVTLADTAGYLAALNWIYDNSRPGNNPHNIRTFTNSWHTSVGEYDPQSALSQAIEATAFENNVISTWSAGNDGRTDPNGATVTTSQQGTTPVAIVNAAYVHNGSAVADFSSRGKVGLEQTYPDVGAPGVLIWSTSARRTGISAGTYSGGNTNPYYLAISGTSMSTPHTAGATALLWQAAPSLRISGRHEDYNGSDAEAWEGNPLTRIHEVEWILEATATYLPPDPAHGNPANDTQVGMDGKPHDYVQGYGIIEMRRAVAVALALEKLRRDNPGRDVTVADALREEQGAAYFEFTKGSTDRLVASWQGEYGRFTDLLGGTLSSANQTKSLYIPPGATSLEFELTFVAVDVDRRTVGDLTWAVDWDGDGTNEAVGSLTPAPPGGHKTGTVAVPSQAGGTQAAVNVIGSGVKVQNPFRDHVYAEWRSHYSIGVTAVLETVSGDAEAVIDRGNYSAMLAPWSFGEPSEGFAGAAVQLNLSYLDISQASLAPFAPPRPAGPTWGLPLAFVLLLLLALGAGAVVVARRPALAARLERLPGGTRLVGVARWLAAFEARAVGALGRRLPRLRRGRA